LFCDISRHGFATGSFYMGTSRLQQVIGGAFWDARLSSRFSGVLCDVASRDGHRVLKRKALVVATTGNSRGYGALLGCYKVLSTARVRGNYRKPYYRELQDGVPFMRGSGYRLCVNAGYRLCVNNRGQTRRFLTMGYRLCVAFRRSQERVGWRAEKDSGRSGLVSVRNQAAARQP
jgi:hypothetical protein